MDTIAPRTANVTWYAEYLSEERALLYGTATYTAQGWTFTPEGGALVPNVTLHDLTLLGHVATVATQEALDASARAETWTHGMLAAGCQLMSCSC